MALSHLSYNQEYLKHKEILDYWDAWVLKNIHFSKSPSKLASKGKEKNRNIDLLLCPVCARHCGRCFICLLILFDLHYNSRMYRVPKEETEAQRQ